MYRNELDPKKIAAERAAWPWGVDDFNELLRERDALIEEEERRSMTYDQRRRHIAAHNRAIEEGCD